MREYEQELTRLREENEAMRSENEAMRSERDGPASDIVWDYHTEVIKVRAENACLQKRLQKMTEDKESYRAGNKRLRKAATEAVEWLDGAVTQSDKYAIINILRTALGADHD